MSTRAKVHILADENMGRSTIMELRAAGYDVVSVKEQHAGMADEDILHPAQSDHREIITHDKDFGDFPTDLIRNAPHFKEELDSQPPFQYT